MIALPPFPWDRLAPFVDKATAHPDGPVNLSIGTPVDPVPEVIQTALAESGNQPGYPQTAGTGALRDAMTDWVRRHCGATGGFGVLPGIGSKEMVAGLPRLLGVAEGDAVAIPSLSYPTYEVGALLAGARAIRTDDPTTDPDPRLRMIWVNHPSNPTGEVISADRLRRIVEWARARDIPVVSDECYVTLGWDGGQASVLDPEVCGGDSTGVLAVHSLSKRSNLAGYRAGFIAGDPELVARLLEIRKHAGLIVPTPVQAAMTVALT
ncbi:MAG: succinyldiaminopimelate transaminase, partial [Stackebrandtia sp.]